ncbi:MAG: M14 family zinc carboxypeptidase [Candidatus Cloacimonadaceae bacterium]
MKSLVLIMILLSCIVINAQPLASWYHTYDEVTTELYQLEAQYPGLAKVYNIGHSQNDNMPIYAMKISDNVQLEETEPAVLFIGQVHAEEVLGVQVTMSNINEILANRLMSPYNAWIAQLEMWFIPTLNPEGHKVVTDGLDLTYRKNKRDTNNNGIFDFSPNVGYDIDGVDINRNFAFNWCHGDTLWQPGTQEQYDYYRGEAPMSESEVQALAAFAQVQKPVYAIIWHSSRNPNSGLFEKLFYPVNYLGVRPAPDLALSAQIGTGVAAQIIKEDGSGPYVALAAEGRKGGTNDWLYQKLGTIALVIECGTNNLQPDSLLMVNTVQRCTNGVKWLLNRALPVSSAVPSSSMLTGTITDAVTGAFLEAEVIVEQRHAPWFAARKSDPLTGRYWRPVSNGTYTLRYRKQGYADLVLTDKTVNNGSWTIVNAAMQPLNPVVLSGSVRSSANQALIPARITLFDVENETQFTNGEFIFNTFGGVHRIEVDAEGFYPYVSNLEINAEAHSIRLDIELSPVTPILTENWENGISNWLMEGPWVLQNELSVSGYAITDSWGGFGFYAQNCDVWIKTSNSYYIPAAESVMLAFDQHLYTEFVYDSVRVDISANNADWQTIFSDSGQKDWWHAKFVPLSDYAGQQLYFRFRLKDISEEPGLEDPGWTLDNIKIISGSASCNVTANTDEIIPALPVTVLYPNFPNPFNPETTLKFSLSKGSKVSLDIYNLKGQKVRNLTHQFYSDGTHSLKWDGKDDHGVPLGSGIYFSRLASDSVTKTQKMILMK